MGVFEYDRVESPPIPTLHCDYDYVISLLIFNRVRTSVSGVVVVPFPFYTRLSTNGNGVGKERDEGWSSLSLSLSLSHRMIERDGLLCGSL